MGAVQLKKLLIDEVSGVDAPANLCDGWMVAKAAEPAFLRLGEEIEAFTKASDSKQPYGDVEYADPGYLKDGTKRYPLDTEEHIRAAWSYINQEKNAAQYSTEQLAHVKDRISAAMKKIGADVSKETAENDGLLAKIRSLLLGDSAVDEGDPELTKEELLTALAEREDALVEKVAEKLAVAEPAPVSDPAPEVVEEETAPALSAEDVQKAVVAALEPYNEILEKTLDRIEKIEDRFAIRKSLDGQEGEPTEEAAPTLKDAIGAAMSGRKVSLT